MARDFDPRRLDVKRFAQDGAELESSEPLSGYERLMGETAGRGGESRVEWSARGEMRNPGHVHPEVWLFLRASTQLELTCQRCLQPVVTEVAVDRSFRFVADEAMAAREDESAEEDVLELSRSFDLVHLVEDELLMEMPLAPRHVICPVVLPTSSGEEELAAPGQARENPFEVLGKLKKH